MAEADPAASGSTLLRSDEFRTVSLDRGDLGAHNIVGLSADRRTRAFNLLRTRLANVLEETNSRLVGVTSATPAAGKSFLSLNLALSLAKVADRPIFLVDLDLRRGSIADELMLEFEHGVNDYLAGDLNITDVGLQIEGLPLVIFPTRRMSETSAEMLSSDIFVRLMQSFRNRADRPVVICDLPPAFASDDAMISVKHLDGYILVVDSTKTSKAHIIDAIAMFETTPCLGTVLNRFVGGMMDTYGYGDRKSYQQYYK